MHSPLSYSGLLHSDFHLDWKQKSLQGRYLYKRCNQWYQEHMCVNLTTAMKKEKRSQHIPLLHPTIY